MGAQAPVAKPRLTAESVVTFAKSSFVLGLMAIGLRFRPGLRDHLFDWGPDGVLGDFRAVFRFRDRAGLAQVWAVFGDGRMKVSGREPRGPGLTPRAADVTVTFRDLGMMRRFFSLGDPPDLLVAMLKGDIVVEGNLSYLGRFGHLSRLAAGRKLRCAAAGRQPRASAGLGPTAAGPGGGSPPGAPATAARDPWARREAMRSGRSRCPPTDKVRYLADVCLSDYSLAHFPRLKAARERLFEARAEICPERPNLITDYYLEHGFETGPDGRDRHPALRQAEALAYLLERRRPIVREDDILAGTTTSKEVGVVVYPEFHGTAIWSELTTVAARDLNPYLIDPETADILDRKVFPYWSERNVREWSRRVNGNPECQRLDERWALYFMWKTAALSHTIPDFSLVLRRGLADLTREAREKEEASARLGSGESGHPGPSGHPDASDRATYYRAMRVALEGVLTYARHLAEEAERMAAELPDERAARRTELHELARICRKVPAQPAETLHEAVQAVWTVWVALHMENSNAGLSLGRLDQVLQPYFAADAERALAEVAKRFSGTGGGTGEEAARVETGPDLEAARVEALRAVTERAIELVGWLFLKCADHLPLVPSIGNLLFAGSSSDQALTVGGVDNSGETAVCDMTYVILKVTELLGLRDPNVNARFCPGVNSGEYLRRLCEVNLITAATPSLHNDNAVIKALVNQGFTVEHARDWAATGCVEPTSVGRHFGHTNCMLLNLVAPLEMALYDGFHPLVGARVGPSTGDPAAGAFPTFDSFKEAYKTHLRYLVEKSIEYNNQLGRAHQYLHPTPLLSCLIEGPMEKGRDLTAGAATYNSSGAALVALTDVVDSLMTVKDLVYERRLVDWPTLLEALRADFRGFEPLHATIMTKVPKFGQDAEEPRALAQELIDFIYEVYQSHVNYRGGRYTTGFWSMSNHVIFGVLSGALPSGRRKGLPFTPGITPAPGVTDQLLPAIRTIAALDPLKMPNNIAFNVKLVPGPGDSHQKTLDQFTAYVRTYFELGGMQMQFNVVSTKTLREAMENPDAYRWLLVRISGYNAYFVDLNRDMQLELIARTEFGT